MAKKWKLEGHSYQIADTGDYDGSYEITDGQISIFTKEDDDELLQPIVDALNASGCNFYQNDHFELENEMLRSQIPRRQSIENQKPFCYESGEWDGKKSEIFLCWVKDSSDPVLAVAYEGFLDGSNFFTVNEQSSDCDITDLVTVWMPIPD